MVIRAYRNSLNTHHHLFVLQISSAAAADALVNGLQAPPTAAAPLLLLLPLPTSSTSQGNFAASFSKERKHLKSVPPCTGEEKHNLCCLPCQDLSTASNEQKEAVWASWFSFDFAVSCFTFWGTSHC